MVRVAQVPFGEPVAAIAQAWQVRMQLAGQQTASRHRPEVHWSLPPQLPPVALRVMQEPAEQKLPGTQSVLFAQVVLHTPVTQAKPFAQAVELQQWLGVPAPPSVQMSTHVRLAPSHLRLAPQA